MTPGPRGAGTRRGATHARPARPTLAATALAIVGILALLAGLAALRLVTRRGVPSGQPAMPSGAPADLLILAVRRDGATLEAHPANGGVVSLAPPPGGPRWLAADATGRLVVTLADGRIVRSSTPAAAGIAWLSVPTPLPGAVPASLSFAAPDAPGERIAALAAAYGTGERASLALVDPGGRWSTTALDVEAAGAPPVWLDDRRVAIAGLVPPTGHATTIVDAIALTAARGPAGISALSVGDDGRRLATVAGDRRSIEIVAGRGWPAGDATVIAHVPAEPAGIVTSLALDPAGRSIAVTWTDADLVPVVVVRYDEAAGWRATTRLPLARGTTIAAVAWMPAAAGAMPP